MTTAPSAIVAADSAGFGLSSFLAKRKASTLPSATDWPPNGCVCWPVWCAPRCVTAKIVECDPLHDRDGKTAALARRLTRCLFQGDLE